MSTKTRLYLVKSKTDIHLVEASTPRGAIAHVARNEFTVSIPAQHEVYLLARTGVEIETAGDESISDETRNAVAQEDLAVGNV